MGLSDVIARWAVARVSVLLAETPGWWVTRAAVERDVESRGWRLATSPADADALVVCGAPAGDMVDVVEKVWGQLPGPRARATVSDPAAARPALDGVRRELLDSERQRDDAEARDRTPACNSASGNSASGNSASGGSASGDSEDMEMAPAGIPLAGGAEDRDGLEMDALHVPLGPVLAHWPAGLVLRCTLHGDVVVEARTEALPAAVPHPHDGGDLAAARRCDGAARLLAVAGWDDAAEAARRARDLFLTDRPEQGADGIRRLHARVSRSRSLRWLLRDLGTIDAATARACHLPAEMEGDVRDRLLAMLDPAASRRTPDPTGPAATAVLTLIPALAAGLDVAAVRLLVASLDPDLAATRPREVLDA